MPLCYHDVMHYSMKPRRRCASQAGGFATRRRSSAGRRSRCRRRTARPGPRGAVPGIGVSARLDRFDFDTARYFGFEICFDLQGPELMLDPLPAPGDVFA